MELFVALIGIFLGGITCYGVTQLTAGTRDLWRELALLTRRPVSLREARDGIVLLRGRARAGRRMLPALTGGPGCVAYRTRSGFGRGGSESVAVFELYDGTGVARIEADRMVLVAPERSDVFGDLTRDVQPGDEVMVVGRLERVSEPGGAFDSYREPPTSLVVRDVPGHGLQIVRPTWQPLANLAKGAFALCASAFGLWLTIGMMG